MHFIRSKTHMKLILNRKEEKTTWHSLVESRREKKTTVHWTSKRHIIRWFSHTTRYILFGFLHEKINSNLKRFYRQINWKMKEIQRIVRLTSCKHFLVQIDLLPPKLHSNACDLVRKTISFACKLFRTGCLMVCVQKSESKPSAM